jgi:hypothetical protein
MHGHVSGAELGAIVVAVLAEPGVNGGADPVA